MTIRNLVSIRTIKNINPIKDADAIEQLTIDGWGVVGKKGEFSIGDKCVYFETDSFLPESDSRFAFLMKNGLRAFDGVRGHVLRTVKLRGTLSQGLALPINMFPEIIEETEGVDISEILGIKKWEPEIPAELAGEVRGVFPSYVRKTDQERIQNLVDEFEQWQEQDLTFEVTEKLDGTSCTFILDAGESDFHVCSRNLDLKFRETNTLWKIVDQYNIKEKMIQNGLYGVAIQGEVIGTGIQNNKYQLRGQDFYVFDIFNITEQKYISSTERAEIIRMLGLKHVPVLGNMKLLSSVENSLLFADGQSVLFEQVLREGLVWKCIENPEISFKTISNKWSLKYKE